MGVARIFTPGAATTDRGLGPRDARPAGPAAADRPETSLGCLLGTGHSECGLAAIGAAGAGEEQATTRVTCLSTAERRSLTMAFRSSRARWPPPAAGARRSRPSSSRQAFRWSSRLRSQFEAPRKARRREAHWCDPDEAEAKAERILGMDIKGHTVRAVLVAEDDITAARRVLPVLPCRPRRAHVLVDVLGRGRRRDRGSGQDPLPRHWPDPVFIAGCTGDASHQQPAPRSCSSTSRRCWPWPCPAERLCWDVFTGEDATLVEVNPLVLTGDGRVIALDAKVTLDDNAAFRHDWGQFADPGAADPLEARAKEKHLNYVKLDGQVGIIGNGAARCVHPQMSSLGDGDIGASAWRTLPRHRRGALPRRSCGERLPSKCQSRPVGPQAVRQRLRRDHSCDAVEE